MSGTVCPYDISYCVNDQCPFNDCERHLSHTKDFPDGTMVSVCNYDAVCRRYIGWLVDQVEEEKKNG